jgi:ADP-ribosyl-[dinitrogen reductase] hydrolase
MLSSQTTHTNIVCLQACNLLARAIVTALQGRSKESVLDAVSQEHFCKELECITSGNYQKKTRKQIESHGWVVATLEAALWCFYKTESFEDGLILAVNLAHDADTVGAVYGALAGAFYGFTNIPDRWLVDLKGKHILDSIYSKFEDVILY